MKTLNVNYSVFAYMSGISQLSYVLFNTLEPINVLKILFYFIAHFILSMRYDMCSESVIIYNIHTYVHK